MNQPEIRDTIAKILRTIAPEANLDQIGPDENLREAVDIDSFDFLNLLIGLHKELKVEIPESDYPKLSTLADLMNYLSERMH
jgi:acyl carrier protein